MSIQIRECEERDEEWIRREWKASQDDFFGAISPGVLEEALWYASDVLANDLLHIPAKWASPSVFFVAEDETGPLGTIAVRIRDNEPEIAHLQRLFTVLTARGRGVATLLVDYCERWIQEKTSCVEVRIETTGYQSRAANMYLRRGYQVVEVGQQSKQIPTLYLKKQIRSHPA